MSRIGRLPIAVPAGVDVAIDGTEVTVKGPKGTLSRSLHPEIGVCRPWTATAQILADLRARRIRGNAVLTIPARYGTHYG